MTGANGLLHEMLDVAENILREGKVSDDSLDVLTRVVLHLYYKDKNHPGDWTASARAILRKRCFIDEEGS